MRFAPRMPPISMSRTAQVRSPTMPSGSMTAESMGPPIIDFTGYCQICETRTLRVWPKLLRTCTRQRHRSRPTGALDARAMDPQDRR